MAAFDDESSFDASGFSGRVRLFPLPNLVLFPHVIQPLHIFEPRYVELLHEALQSDRLITMALLQPGWERDYEGRPPLAPIGCLSRVVTWQAQGDRRYNILLMGLKRVQLVNELPAERAFREAEAEIVEDLYPSSSAPKRCELHKALIAELEQSLPTIKDADELFNQVSLGNVSLGALTDIIAYAVDWDIADKQKLLAEPDVDRRAAMLLARLSGLHQPACPARGEAFPPAFSSN